MRTALEVADIFRRHGAAYRSAHDAHMGRVERRIMGAIEVCRTASLGGHVEACEDWRHSRIAYNSCRNRHCPKCQGLARAEWLADRQADLLPAPYFHVVFTVPAEVAAMVSLLFTPSGAETLVFWVSQPLAWLVAPKDVLLMTRRGDLKLSHGATAKARENAVKQDRVQTTNAIKSP